MHVDAHYYFAYEFKQFDLEKQVIFLQNVRILLCLFRSALINNVLSVCYLAEFEQKKRSDWSVSMFLVGYCYCTVLMKYTRLSRNILIDTASNITPKNLRDTYTPPLPKMRSSKYILESTT